MQKKHHKRIDRFVRILDVMISDMYSRKSLQMLKDNRKIKFTKYTFKYIIDQSILLRILMSWENLQEVRHAIVGMTNEVFENESTHIRSNDVILQEIKRQKTTKITNIEIDFDLKKIKHLTKDDFKRFESNLKRELIFRELQR